MYKHGTVHIDGEMQDRLRNSDSDPIQALKDEGLLVVVEMQDFGWAQVDPPVAVFNASGQEVIEDVVYGLNGEKLTREEADKLLETQVPGQPLTAEGDETSVLYHDDHPVVEGQPGGFGNLNG